MAPSVRWMTVFLFFLMRVGQAQGEVISEELSEPLLSPGSPTAWHASDGADMEIFLSEGGVTTQLTFNEFDDSFPHRSGDLVAWQGWDGNDWEIFQFDGENTTQLTTNDVDDISAYVSGTIVEWQGWDGNDWEIFQFDGSITTQITDNNVDDWIEYPIELGGPPPGGEPSTIALASFAILAYAWRRRRHSA